MMADTRQKLIDRLPGLRGRISENVALAGVTWFRVGGPAEIVFRPADRDDLVALVTGRPADVPLTVIGVGSNLLVRDGGVAGVVIRLGRAFAGVEISDDEIFAGASALDLNVAIAAREAGLEGLEFLSGIPGTIGGALRMNAGAYGREIRDVLIAAEAMDPSGAIHFLAPGEMDMGYRHCGVPEDWIFLSARLRTRPGDKAEIARRMADIAGARKDSQPVRSRTGGSTFKNPDGAKAWQLIDKAGMRGFAVGGAKVSELHCNFLINEGDATASDLEELGEAVRRKVREVTGTDLHWEIRRIGTPAGGGEDGAS